MSGHEEVDFRRLYQQAQVKVKQLQKINSHLVDALEGIGTLEQSLKDSNKDLEILKLNQFIDSMRLSNKFLQKQLEQTLQEAQNEKQQYLESLNERQKQIQMLGSLSQQQKKQITRLSEQINSQEQKIQQKNAQFDFKQSGKNQQIQGLLIECSHLQKSLNLQRKKISKLQKYVITAEQQTKQVFQQKQMLQKSLQKANQQISWYKSTVQQIKLEYINSELKRQEATEKYKQQRSKSRKRINMYQNGNQGHNGSFHGSLNNTRRVISTQSKFLEKIAKSNDEMSICYSRQNSRKKLTLSRTASSRNAPEKILESNVEIQAFDEIQMGSSIQNRKQVQSTLNDCQNKIQDPENRYKYKQNHLQNAKKVNSLNRKATAHRKSFVDILS